MPSTNNFAPQQFVFLREDNKYGSNRELLYTLITAVLDFSLGGTVVTATIIKYLTRKFGLVVKAQDWEVRPVAWDTCLHDLRETN